MYILDSIKNELIKAEIAQCDFNYIPVKNEKGLPYINYPDRINHRIQCAIRFFASLQRLQCQR